MKLDFQKGTAQINSAMEKKPRASAKKLLRAPFLVSSFFLKKHRKKI